MHKKTLIIGGAALLSLGIFSGCFEGKIDDSGLTPPAGIDILKEYETVGDILQFEDNAVHILTGDIAQIYKVTNKNAKDFYVGETVAIKKISNDSFELVKYKLENFEVRHTNMGQQILKSDGTIKELTKDSLVLTTENGDLSFTFHDDIYLEKGTDLTVEYLQMGKRNYLVQFYDENYKLDLKITKVNRLKDGSMKLNTETSDSIKYNVTVSPSTILELNFSDLKKDENITVYPNVIKEIYPAEVEAKLIRK